MAEYTAFVDKDELASLVTLGGRATLCGLRQNVSDIQVLVTDDTEAVKVGVNKSLQKAYELGHEDGFEAGAASVESEQGK